MGCLDGRGRAAFLWTGDSRANFLTRGVTLLIFLACLQFPQRWHYQQLVLLAACVVELQKQYWRPSFWLEFRIAE